MTALRGDILCKMLTKYILFDRELYVLILMYISLNTKQMYDLR